MITDTTPRVLRLGITPKQYYAEKLRELQDFADGFEACYRGENPQEDWSQAKLKGWNEAGKKKYWAAMEQAGWPDEYREGWVGQ